MAKMKNWLDYDRNRRDFERLEAIAELTDQVSLDSDRLALMRNPTKVQAARMYLDGIELWLFEHGVHAAPDDIAEFYRR